MENIAIFGTGPAGITLAKELAKKGFEVSLFEAGDLDGEFEFSDTKDPYEAEINEGIEYSTKYTRLRQFGGSSGHWGGWCRPLDPIDFEPRDEVDSPGWPIDISILNPFYSRALDVLEVKTPDGMESFNRDVYPLSFVDTPLKVKNFFFSPPKRFRSSYQGIQKTNNIKLHLNRTLVNLINDGGKINKAILKNNQGETFSIEADSYILCLGGIENARLLMASGIQNENPNLGRFFSDHLGTSIGYAIFSEQIRFDRHLNEEGIEQLPHLSFEDDFLKQNKILNFGCVFNNYNGDEVGNSIAELASSKENHTVRKAIIRLENAPSRHSRISLQNAKDAYGVPKISLAWQPNETDVISTLRVSDYLKSYFRALGIRSAITFPTKPILSYSYQAHHCGTTRMGNSINDSVVDRNLRCHTMSNLFVSGSSVFPSYGFANPTLTIIALTLRLADHLETIR